jgi:hypothetical protein
VQRGEDGFAGGGHGLRAVWVAGMSLAVILM